jgi:hypothetical protein
MIRGLLSAPLCLHIRLSSRFPRWPEMWIVPLLEYRSTSWCHPLQALETNEPTASVWLRLQTPVI